MVGGLGGQDERDNEFTWEAVLSGDRAPCPGYTLYEINEHGQFIYKPTNSVIKPTWWGTGRCMVVALYVNSSMYSPKREEMAAKLILQAFKGQPVRSEGRYPEVHYADGNPRNLAVNNLSFVNWSHRYANCLEGPEGKLARTRIAQEEEAASKARMEFAAGVDRALAEIGEKLPESDQSRELSERWVTEVWDLAYKVRASYSSGDGVFAPLPSIVHTPSDLPLEVWYPINTAGIPNGRYEISILGRVRSACDVVRGRKKGQIVTCERSDGQRTLTIPRKTITVAALMLDVFGLDPRQVRAHAQFAEVPTARARHIDGNSRNDCLWNIDVVWKQLVRRHS